MGFVPTVYLKGTPYVPARTAQSGAVQGDGSSGHTLTLPVAGFDAFVLIEAVTVSAYGCRTCSMQTDSPRMPKAPLARPLRGAAPALPLLPFTAPRTENTGKSLPDTVTKCQK